MLPDTVGATVGAALAAAFALVLLQRHFDRAAQAEQREHENEAARDADLTEGVIAVWGAATRVMNIAWSLSQRSIRTYRFGELIGPLLLELNRTAGELITAYTRVFLSADDHLVRAAERVLAAGQAFDGVVGGAPWWRPILDRKRRAALDKALDEMGEALRELRALTRTALGREPPDIDAGR